MTRVVVKIIKHQLYMRISAVSTFVTTLSILTLVLSVLIVQQHLFGQQALFTVVSPLSGQVVHPGDVIQVIVQPTSGVTLDSVSVWSPFLVTSRQPAAPILITIPDGTLGPVTLGILVKTLVPSGAGQNIDVTIDVQAPAQLQLVRVSPGRVALVLPATGGPYQSLGRTTLRVTGSFTDGIDRDITRISGIILASANPGVATIGPDGTVTAVAPGVTMIQAKYGSATANATIQVNIFELRGDFDGDGDVDQDDINFLLRALNTVSTGPGDPRDLNGDGRIDALDSRILATLCSRTACARQ